MPRKSSLANEIHSILANIALMNEEDKLILQQRHFDEVTHLKHALKVRSDEAEDLHNKMHHLILIEFKSTEIVQKMILLRQKVKK